MNIPRFSAEASLYGTNRHYHLCTEGLAADRTGRVSPALVGHWPVPGTGCGVTCIEVCTRFCHPTGWDCCQWETRCALSCDGNTILTTY